MPWKAISPMDLRKELMARLHRGERMADLCREYGISRKTGHKFKARFERAGDAGLVDQSRARHLIRHKTDSDLLEHVFAERRKHPTWGPRKLKEVLERRLDRRLPSHTTLSVALSKAGLITPRKQRPRHSSVPTRLRVVSAPNEVWCMDYKGQFRLGDRSYCYPLTITDQCSRYILACEGMPAIRGEEVRDVCIDVFRQWGLPHAIRSDNGAPFASSGLGGLTKLSVFFIRLGVELERIRPAHPEENGRHERMHRTLKAETTRPARKNLLQQQERFDEWTHEFNYERPHEALGMRRPAEAFSRSSRPMPTKLTELTYPTHDDVIRVNRWGQASVAGRGMVHVSTALAGETLGVREERDGRLLITFVNLDLGHIQPSGDLVPLHPKTSN